MKNGSDGPEIGGLNLSRIELAVELSRLHELLAHAELRHDSDIRDLADLRANESAWASSEAQARVGRAGLHACTQALASSRAEALEGREELRAGALLSHRLSVAYTELADSEDMLRKGEQRLRRLIEAAPTAMVIVNAAGRIERVNAEAELLFGYARAELLGGTVERLLPAGFQNPSAELATGLADDRVSALVNPATPLFCVRKDGTRFEVQIGLGSIEGDDGPEGLYSIVDISRRVRLEAQTRQSQKMQAIGRVTAGVAHDFNDLLQVVGGSLELLLNAVADRPASWEWGQVTLRAASRGKELTDRLLSLSGQQRLVARPVVISELLCELRQMIGPLFQIGATARTELALVPCADGLALLADPAQLMAALLNLVVNARDAMAQGGTLRISAYQAEGDPAIVAPGRYTVISIADTGCGMSADTLVQACEPYFSTKGANGTGLGLSMVQGFARQSGGEAHITSKPGEGTTVDLWLPYAMVPGQAEPSSSLPVASAGRVLVVDDSEDALLVVAAFLRVAGLSVTSRISGDLALAELARGERFDVIISDFAMPGMNGVELLALAREVDPAMRGMIITGFTDPDLLGEADGIAVLRKPFNRSELTQAVRQLISAPAVAAVG